MRSVSASESRSRLRSTAMPLMEWVSWLDTTAARSLEARPLNGNQTRESRIIGWVSQSGGPIAHDLRRINHVLKTAHALHIPVKPETVAVRTVTFPPEVRPRGVRDPSGNAACSHLTCRDARKSLGDWPVLASNARVKALRDAKPTRSATRFIGKSVIPSRSPARLIRKSRRSSIGPDP